MVRELKLIISDNKRTINTISKETLETHPAFMIKALNEFRLQVNAEITKLIEDSNDTSDIIEEEEGNSDIDGDIEVSPKKQKK